MTILYIILIFLVITVLTIPVFTILDTRNGEFEIDNFLFMICLGLPMPTYFIYLIINFLINQ